LRLRWNAPPYGCVYGARGVAGCSLPVRVTGPPPMKRETDLERGLAAALALLSTLATTLDTVLLAPVRARFRLRLASSGALFQALLGAAPRKRGKQKGGQDQAHRDSLVHRVSKERSG
jgi:hypothetical protein